MNCFSHPPRMYPPLVPTGPTRVTLPAYPPTPPTPHARWTARSATTRTAPTCATSATHRRQPRSYPHSAQPAVATTHPGRARRSPCRWPVPRAVSMAPTSYLPWVVASLIAVVHARRSPRLSMHRRGRNPSMEETDVPATSCRASPLRICSGRRGAPRRSSTKAASTRPPSQRFRQLCSRLTADLPPTCSLCPHRVAGPVTRPCIGCWCRHDADFLS
jgi:hypothetical protein